jgi:hypothetical protein
VPHVARKSPQFTFVQLTLSRTIHVATSGA